MKVNVYYPNGTQGTHEVKLFAPWSERLLETVPIGTKLTVFGKTGGTAQYELKREQRDYWTILRKTYGP